MQYRNDKKGNAISLLGYGCMRFSRNNNKINIDKAEEEVMTAIRAGVNYFDTAYIYPGSEAALGEILHRNNCRQQIYIATKLPHYLLKSKEKMEKMFQEELRRLQTDYIDYYLLHMLTDLQTWQQLQKLGIEEWIQEKLSNGQIRNIGFSYHGSTDHFLQLVDAYDWDFCQIQYNYMDEHSQAGYKGLQYAHEKGLPVIIMEPLRGGRLVDMLSAETKKLFNTEGRNRTPAEWAFRWLFNQSEVTCVLSGMNSLDMVQENIRIASESSVGEFTKEDFNFIEKVKTSINHNTKVGCTGCGYCMPCPKGVDIPGTFRCYNNMYSENKKSGRRDYLQCTTMRQSPSSASLCIGCGKCEKHCPQQLPIRAELKNAAKELETPMYKLFKFAIHTLHLWG